MQKHSNHSRTRFVAFLAAGLSMLSAASAQFVEVGQKFESSVSLSSKSDVRKSVKLGEASVLYSHVEYANGFALDEDTKLMAGLGFSQTDFSLDHRYAGRLVLPDRLENLSLTLAAERRLSPTMALSLAAQPGFRGSEGHYGKQAFSVPLVVGLSYAKSRDLIYLFGVAYDEFSEYQVVPMAGVLWNVNPKWMLSIGFPRTGVTYKASEDLKFYANLSVEGGSYYVKGHNFPSTGVINPGEPPYPPALHDTFLDYREIRVGSGLEYKLAGTITLQAEAGMVTTRRWEYHQKDYDYRGRPAAFANLSLKVSF